MIPLLEQLTGVFQEKPFECVGSRDEINTAIVMTIDNIEAEQEKLPLLLEHYKKLGLYAKYKPMGDRYSDYFDSQNLVPKEWEALVKEKCAQRRTK